jgi:hypothetical protein
MSRPSSGVSGRVVALAGPRPGDTAPHLGNTTPHPGNTRPHPGNTAPHSASTALDTGNTAPHPGNTDAADCRGAHATECGRTPRGSRPRSVIARAANGQPRTYRLAPSSSPHAAYRRLALAILTLDVATLADQLRSARRAVLPHAA